MIHFSCREFPVFKRVVMGKIKNEHLVLAVIVISLHWLPSFAPRPSVNYLPAIIVLFSLAFANLAVCVVGALKTTYKLYWIVFGLLSVLTTLLFSAANPIAFLIVLARMAVWSWF